MKTRKAVFLGLLFFVVCCGCVKEAKVGKPNLSPDIERRVEKLLAKMTLEEKLGQMSQMHEIYRKESLILENEIRAGRVGSFLNFFDIEKRNRFQRIAVEQSRLGIPLIFGADVIHGHRTIFPVPLAEAASWNMALAERTAKIAAREARAAGIDWTFGPMIDIARDPRWGRIVEGAGEDTYLGSLMARAKVRGFQGDDYGDSERIAACLKHFAGYGAAQAGRDYHTTDIPERVLRNVYLPPFKAGVEEGAATIMSGFNDINGVPVSGNRFLMTDILRGEWGFEGFVLSDWKSVTQLIDHGVAEDEQAAAVIAATAGVDMEMVSSSYIDHLDELVRKGKFPLSIIDEAVSRILRVKFRAGLFENPYTDVAIAPKVMLADEHLEIARQMARESMVLLKNENQLLPLKKNVKSIALIGPLANSRKDMLGTWSLGGREEDVVTMLDGLKKALPNCEINYAKGCDVLDTSKDGFNEALEAANNSDVVIMAIGESAELNGEAHCRTNLDLPGVQRELLHQIHATGKDIVVVLFTGRPLTIGWMLENVNSVLIAWHPGVQGGNAIADVLFGEYNPAGKLTVTFPRNVGQIPIFYNMKNTGRPEDPTDPYTTKYIDVPNTPLLPFGFGLSYTTFEYENLKIEKDKVSMSGSLTVSADIKNTGKYPGEEIVQLYIHDITGSVTRPVKELKGFEKISLKPGQTKTLTFTLSTDDLRFYDINMNFVAELGKFDLWIGPNSAEGLKGSFELTN